jgi:hypothetical protein
LTNHEKNVIIITLINKEFFSDKKNVIIITLINKEFFNDEKSKNREKD